MNPEIQGGIHFLSGSTTAYKYPLILCSLPRAGLFVEWRLRVLEVRRVEAFGEPVVGRREEVSGLVGRWHVPSLLANVDRLDLPNGSR